MIRRILANKYVKRFLYNHTEKLFCQIYGHTYLISYSEDRLGHQVHHRCYCYHCRVIFGDLEFPMYLYRVSSALNPQYRMAVEKWLNEIGLLDVEIEKLIRNLQQNRITHMTKCKVNKNKNLQGVKVH